MNEKIKEMFDTWKSLFLSLFKWILFSALIGGIVGAIASGFAHTVTLATHTRETYPLLVLGLPIGGLLIVFLYHKTGQSENKGTNLVLSVIRSSEERIPGPVVPLILLSTVITHFFGGSSGREGAALQFGAGVGDYISKRIHLSESDRKIMILAGMSAAFSALFGTPLAAVIFPMEVVSVGVMYYAALVPCVFSAFIAQHVAVLLKVRVLGTPYPVTDIPHFYALRSLKFLVLAVACALVGTMFCILLHKMEHLYKSKIPNPYLRVIVGGTLVVILYFVLGTEDYLGLGEAVIHGSFATCYGPDKFIWKMVFTGLTLCAGFKGGEIVPSLFIGATLGSFLSGVLHVSPALCAACGMVGVFCAVTNCPIASMLIAAEMFGFAGMPYYCIVIAVSYLISGYHSLYSEQKIMYSKTKNQYIDRKTH